jgi:hypothetical protein
MKKVNQEIQRIGSPFFPGWLLGDDVNTGNVSPMSIDATEGSKALILIGPERN